MKKAFLLLAAGLLFGGLMGAQPAAADRHEGHNGMSHKHHRSMKACMAQKDSKTGCCPYIACGEVGNGGFFTKTKCEVCTSRSGQALRDGGGSCCCSAPDHKAKRVKFASHPEHGGKAKLECCTYPQCHEVGNRGFFTRTRKHLDKCCDADSKCDEGACEHHKHRA